MQDKVCFEAGGCRLKETGVCPALGDACGRDEASGPREEQVAPSNASKAVRCVLPTR